MVESRTMGDSNFNRLERAVLDWCIKRYNGTAVAEQLKRAVFVSREWTKVGFYVHFKVQGPIIPEDVVIPIDGPGLHSPSIEHGGGSLLWGDKGGYLRNLEMYSFGKFEEDVPTFTVTDPKPNY